MGPGRVTESGTKVLVNVAVGDIVLLPEYGGQALKLGKEEFSLFRDEDILGKFEVRGFYVHRYHSVSVAGVVTSALVQR